MRGIRVLAVDDNADLVDLTAEALEREDEAFSVTTETDPEDALARLRDGRIDGVVSDYDCVVSDYDMPGMDGLEVLAEVRSDYPEIPFILFTGKGSEEIAAEAISNGVTDYLQKEGGLDQYTLLANRIKNGVKQYRATKEAARTKRFLEKVLERATDMVAVVSPGGDVTFASGSVERILGYTPEELEELGPFALVEGEDQDRIEDLFERRLTDPDTPTEVCLSVVHKDGQTVDCRARAYDLTDDPDVNGVLIYTREEHPETPTDA